MHSVVDTPRSELSFKKVLTICVNYVGLESARCVCGSFVVAFLEVVFGCFFG